MDLYSKADEQCRVKAQNTHTHRHTQKDSAFIESSINQAPVISLFFHVKPKQFWKSFPNKLNQF